MLKIIGRVALIVFSILSPLFSVYAQQMPPVQVVVSKIRSGMVAPENEFIGTVYYQEVSDIASEVSGKVESVEFEEGQRINKGEVLVRLSSDLLEKSLNAIKASYEEVISELEKAERELKRAENLYKEELISEQIYDDKRFRVIGLKKKVASLKAEVERIEIELEKKQ